MNQAQRTFLIKKIQEKVSAKLRALETSKPDAPDLNQWLLQAVLSGNFEIRTTEEIKATLVKKALNAKERENWLGNSFGSANKTNVNFKPYEIFVLPEVYKLKYEEYRAAVSEIDQKYKELVIQSDTLITRIQLASDKTLQKMIDEVDDMGDISLMDTKLKMIQ